MQIISGTTEFHIEDCTAVAIGKFDGVHRGHKEIMAHVLETGNEGFKTAIFTFDPIPSVFFGGENVKELTTRSEKELLFEKLGIDYLVEFPFNLQTAQMDPQTFVKEVLLEKMNAGLIIAGDDISFGKDGKGNDVLLEQMSVTEHFQVRIIKKICRKNREISSTYVREALEKGDVSLAGDLLGEPFFVMGIVEEGNRFGRTMGIPTINLYPEKRKLLPPSGVYFSSIEINDRMLYGVTNIGQKPTVSEKGKISVETFIFDFAEDIYGCKVKVNLLHFEREERRFSSVEELQQEILKNIEDGKNFFEKRRKKPE